MTLYRECERCHNDGFECPACDSIGFVPIDPAALRETIARAIGDRRCYGRDEWRSWLTQEQIAACADDVLAAIGGKP